MLMGNINHIGPEYIRGYVDEATRTNYEILLAQTASTYLEFLDKVKTVRLEELTWIQGQLGIRVEDADSPHTLSSWAMIIAKAWIKANTEFVKMILPPGVKEAFSGLVKATEVIIEEWIEMDARQERALQALSELEFISESRKASTDGYFYLKGVLLTTDPTTLEEPRLRTAFNRSGNPSHNILIESIHQMVLQNAMQPDGLVTIKDEISAQIRSTIVGNNARGMELGRFFRFWMQKHFCSGQDDHSTTDNNEDSNGNSAETNHDPRDSITLPRSGYIATWLDERNRLIKCAIVCPRAANMVMILKQCLRYLGTDSLYPLTLSNLFRVVIRRDADGAWHYGYRKRQAAESDRNLNNFHRFTVNKSDSICTDLDRIGFLESLPMRQNYPPGPESVN